MRRKCVSTTMGFISRQNLLHSFTYFLFAASSYFPILLSFLLLVLRNHNILIICVKDTRELSFSARHFCTMYFALLWLRKKNLFNFLWEIKGIYVCKLLMEFMNFQELILWFLWLFDLCSKFEYFLWTFVSKIVKMQKSGTSYLVYPSVYPCEYLYGIPLRVSLGTE